MKFVLRCAAVTLAASMLFSAGSSATVAAIAEAAAAVPEHASSSIALLAFAGLGLARRGKRRPAPIQIA